MSFILFISVHEYAAQNYPPGFVEETLDLNLSLPSGLLFADTGMTFIWELNGKVWLYRSDVLSAEPVIDISEEVSMWGDHGMIGAALHPSFLENGYIYLYYTVDRHYLQYYGTDEYDPEITETAVPIMGRITRYQLNTVDFSFAIPGSRTILLGAEVGEGIPIPTWSHGVGSLVFGEDGSLLASSGDGSTWVAASNGFGYNGQGPVPPFAFDSLALHEGLLSPDQMLGSFRSQYLDGLNGKVLRINPESGEGLPNNPFFNPEEPDSPRSKTYALGLRNPYRMSIRKGTGHGGLEDGFPGHVYISDVGDWVWEEINVIKDSGRNFGWPMFQGPVVHPHYFNNRTANTNAPNPFYGKESNCSEPFHHYQHTLLPDNEAHSHLFIIPCSPTNVIDEDVNTFIHERPLLAYANEVNTSNPHAVTPIFDESGDESFTPFSDPDSPVKGDDFTGLSASGVAFLYGEAIPLEYQDWFVFADYSGWIRAAKLDENDELSEVELWNDNAGRPIFINQNPFDGCIYYSSLFPTFVKRICYGGNRRPVVVVSPDQVYGTSPLEVQFTTEGTYDPDGDPISFLWTFCDGSNSSEANPLHQFEATYATIETCEIGLTVTDTAGAQSSVQIFVSLNNTPPVAEIASIENGELYSTKRITPYNLSAVVSDNEHSHDEMEYRWTLLLHHNTHFHKLRDIFGNNTMVEISPTGCSPFEKYWYEIQLLVTDPGGLSSFDSRTIFPDCKGIQDALPYGGKEFSVLPNPAQRYLEIRSKTPMKDWFRCEVYRLDGRLVFRDEQIVYNRRNFVQIDVSELDNGLYVIRYEVNGKSRTDKFVKLAE